MRAALLSLVGLCSLLGVALAFAPREPGDAGLALVLKVAAPVVEEGKPLGITAELVNNGTEPITVVLPGDGSDCGWRTPILTWEPGQRGEGGRCGNINALTANEVVELAPGQRIKLGAWLRGPSVSRPGKYRVSLTFENDPKRKWRGEPLGRHDPAAMAKVRASKAFRVVSNIVEIELVEAKK